MNIYQAAILLRETYVHTGISLDFAEENNTYLVFHDALHSFLGAAPNEQNEPIVLATELVLGGQEWKHLFSSVTAEEISNRLVNIDEKTLEIFIDFYVNYFN